jgi:hypothetical protein
MKINKYPDGTSYVELDWELKTNLVVTDFRINSYEDLWHFNQYKSALIYNNIEANITIPCLIDAQADRRFKKTQSSGLGLISDIFNGSRTHGINIKVFHPHNPEVTEALFDSVDIIDNSEFIEKVLNLIEND